MLFGNNAQQKGNNQQFPNAGPRFPRTNNFNNPNAAGFPQQQQGQRPPRMMQQRNQNQGQNQQQFGGQNQGFNQQGNFNQNRQQRNSPLGFSVGNAGGQQFNNKFGNQGGAQNQGGFGNRGNMQQNQGGFGNRNAMQNQGGQGGPGGQGGFGNRGNMQQNQGGFGNRPNMGQRNFGGGQNQQQFGGQNQGFNQQGNNPNQGRPQRSPIGFGTPATTAPIGFGSSQNTQNNQGQQGGQQFGNNRFNKTFQNAGGVTGFGQKPTNAQFRGNQGQNDQGGMGQAGGFGGNQWKQGNQQQQQQDGGFQGRQPYQKQGGGPGGFQPKQFGLRRTPQGFQRNQGNHSMSQDNTQMSTDRPQGRGGFQGQKQFGDRSHSDEGQGRPPYQRGQHFAQQQGDMDGKMESREDGYGFGRGRGRGNRGRGERGSRFTVRGERGGRFGRGRGERGRGRGAGRGGRSGGGDRFEEENDREEDKRDRDRDRDEYDDEEEEEDDRDDYSDEHDDEEPYSGEDDEYGDSQDDEESPRGRYDRDDRSSESPKKGGPDLRNLISGGNKPSISDRIIKKSDQDAPPPPPKKEAPKLMIKPAPKLVSQPKPMNEADVPKMTNKDRKRIVAKYGLDDRNANEVELERLYRQEIMQGTLEEPEPEKESPTHAAPRNRPVSLNQRFLTNIVKQTLTGREGDAAPPPPPQKKEPAPTTTTAAAPVVSTPSMQISRQMSNQSKQQVQSLKDRLKQSQKASVKKPTVSLDEPDVYIAPEVIERFRAILDRGLIKEDDMVRGECMTMAPIDENRGTDMFERERGTETPRPEWFVKKYERAGADKNFNDPRQLRPLGVLRETMDYLVNNIIDVEKKKNARYALPKGRDKYRFDDIHNFIWGAFRSIKQDISIQRCSGERFAIELHEEIARYYLIAINEGKDPELRQFDSKLNIDQLTDTLTSLRLGYKEARNMAFKAYHLLKDQPGFNIQVMSRFEDKFYLSPNEAEFLAYDMIIQLENERNYLDILQRIMTFPNEVLVSKDVKFAIKVVTAVKENNYPEYFRLLGEADYLTSCVMSTLIKSIREKAIKAMSRSQARNNIETVSINKFYELLAFEDTQEAELFLRTYGLEEASQGMDIDDIQGSEGTSFRLQKVQIDGDEAKLEARKKFVALKPAMNIRIIETKRNIENFKSYQGDRDIHFDNTQVPRKFLVKGAWKHADPRHYLKVLKYMLNLNIEVPKQQERVAKPLQQIDEAEEEEGQAEEIEDLKAEKSKTGLFSQPIDKTSDLTIQRRMSSVPEPAKDLKKEKEKEDDLAKRKAEQDAAEKKKREKEEEEKRRKEAEREAERKRQQKLAEEKKKKQEKMAKFAAKLGEVLSEAVLETQKQTFMYLESVVEYERELKAFRQGILQKTVKMGLAPQPLRYSGMVPDLAVMEEELEEEQHVFFRFLADSLAEHEPELERYCYKAVLFHPLFKDMHFELFRKMIEFLTDNQEKLEQIEFDQLPTLYENKNIEFEVEGEVKKLWVCFKVYDENYKAQDPKEKMNEENPKEGETGALIVPPADILGSNLIIFVLTGNKKLDKERFDPIYNAIMNKRHLENINILFLQAFEVKMDNTEKKLKKKDIIELFGLTNLYEKGLQHHFIKLPYLFSTEMDNMKFVFKDIDYALKDKVTAVVKKGIEDQIYTNLPSFYTLRDLTEKLRNSLEELGDLKIDYESSEIEIKAKLLHEIMSSRSIESYFYVKNFLNHAVNSIKENFNYWYENLDRVAPEFLDNYNEKVVEKIKTARREFLTILDKMFKINDFDDKYWRLLEYGSNARLNVNSIYSLLERKVEKIFRSRKRDIRMDEVIGVLERNFKFGVIGVKGSWKLLFKTVYEYYMQFLDDLQPICILLDEDFKLDINIDALYADIENDLARYNEWITELEFQQYDAEEHVFEVTEAMEKTLLRKRPIEVFVASESSILPKDEDIIEDKEGISELDQINITTKKPLNNSSFLNNNPLPYLTLDWDFDKQFQTLKRIHIDDDMFTI